MINNAKLQNAFKLSSKVTLYVPATVEVNKEVNNTEYVNKALKLLSSCFGGATSTSALGAWLSPVDGLVKEKTTIVFAYCNNSDLEEHIEEVIELAEELKKDMSQEAIALEINGEMYFI